MKNFVWIFYGAAAIIFGFIFGTNWDGTAENFNLEIRLGDFFTLFGAIIGIMGAYFVATKQRRDEKNDNEKRVLFLVSVIRAKVEIACKQAETADLKIELVNSISRLRDTFKELPIECIPTYFLDDVHHFISVIDKRLDNFKFLAERGVFCPDPVTHCERLAAILDEVNTAEAFFLKSLEWKKHL